MKIGEQIKKYRKSSGLTQEQVADYLGISTPAVNKWEKGNTCPDIALLPAIARLFQIDMNELFSFREELSEFEINQFVQELSKMAVKNIKLAFKNAIKKIQEYPRCELLIYKITTVLNSGLALNKITDDESIQYEEIISRWLGQLMISLDDKMRFSAIYMGAVKCVQNQKYDEANLYLDKLPDTVIDTTMLKTDILMQQGYDSEATIFLESHLMQGLINIQSYLYKLIELEEKAKDHEQAQQIAGIAAQMADLCNLENYRTIIPYLMVAVYDKDINQSIKLIKEILDKSHECWDINVSPLYARIDSEQSKNYSDAISRSFRETFIAEIHSHKEYEFLRDNQKVQQILEKA